jgi:hypothetical protein
MGPLRQLRQRLPENCVESLSFQALLGILVGFQKSGIAGALFQIGPLKIVSNFRRFRASYLM